MVYKEGKQICVPFCAVSKKMTIYAPGTCFMEIVVLYFELDKFEINKIFTG